jgi:membrane protein implicated in regulation of membrane protease activity
MGVRPRALVLLLALTAGDYVLWNWSIAGGHDIVSLVAGLTLLPLAALSLGGLAIVGGRVLRLLLGRPSTVTRSTQASREVAARERALNGEASEADSSSGRLAA